MQSDTDGKKLTADDLRSRAEELIRKAESPEKRRKRAADDTLKLVHELEVHQIELEIQTAELHRVMDAREKVETALDRYTDLYDFAPVGYFTLDRAGVIIAANLRAATLLHSERARLLGRPFGQFVATEARPAFTALLEKTFTSRDKESCDVSLKVTGNSPLFAQIEAIAFGAGQECRIALIDITGRKLAEDALIEKTRELEELNRSMEVRIAQAVDELREKDKLLFLLDRRAVMGEMINNIAHQWRQPLNILGLVIQQLPYLYDAGELDREFLEKNVGKSMEVILQMSRTIDEFRSFFSSDKETVTFGVNQVIARTLSLIEKNLQGQRIRVVHDPDGDPMASGYPNEYTQVLLNILMNSRDALVEHNVDNALISIRSSAEGGKSVVTISDNSGGIPDKIIGKVFDPYFTTNKPDQGTGIGLFMAKTIIEKNMGGELTVRNTGSGAEFRIVV
ncbi:MAG TPA: PAS domain-containing sensor histidine kinase [Dongiaceae bacterium]|nr:PAS domain-containing sensor histidine kinase [Dongiaceae bacterium]